MSSFCLLEKNKEFEIVKLGFSWKIFFLNFFWGLSEKIWSFSIVWYFSSLFFVVGYFYSLLDFSFLVFFFILTALYWGFYGNFLLINNLMETRGFIPKKVISSSNYKDALLIFLSEK